MGLTQVSGTINSVIINQVLKAISIIIGVFSNIIGFKNPIGNNGRTIRCFRIKGISLYIVQEDGNTKAITVERPSRIEIYPLLQCNLACTYCDRGKESSMLEDFNEIAILYDNLRRDKSFHLLNFRISGGEPTIYPKINELISFLHTIDPCGPIDFLTNAIELRKLTKQSIGYIRIKPSIYPYTEKILKEDSYIVNLFELQGMPLETPAFYHEDLSVYGSVRNNFNSVENCFIATLLCGTKRVYPCCRAHRLEQDYNKKYHLDISSPYLYKNLKSIITDTDLCVHCPRIYSDCKKILLSN